MKKYLTLAAILGAVAFLSVSYLAQAESEAVHVDAATTETHTTTTAVEGKIDLAKITADCKAEAAHDKADGTKKTEAETTAAFNDCLKAKTGTAMQEDAKPVDGTVVKEGEHK